MRATTDWVRFLLVTLLGAAGIFGLEVIWHGVVLRGLYEAYPLRPDDQLRALMPFLLLTYFLQLPVFCYLYLRVYRERTLANALWWGAWGGFFVLTPNTQYFVGIPHMGWGLLALQVVGGMGMMMILMGYFTLAYRPRPLGKVQEPLQVDTDWVRFIPTAIVVSLVIAMVDLAFHGTVAPRLFPGVYPPADYPQRDPAEAASMVPFLLSAYVFQIGLFFYLFLRIYPERGWGNAVWWGIWGSLFLYIPDAQIFVSEDKYTWTMLGIQLIEGVILPLVMILTFELVFRPRAGRVAGGRQAVAGAAH
jgi:hypothetical protein